MLFLHLPSAIDDCTSLAFLRSPSITVTDAPSPINCPAPTKFSHAPCALLAQCSTTQTWVCTWTIDLHTTSFAQQGPCFIQLPSFQILTCNPSPMNFPDMMISCTLSSPARGVRGPRWAPNFLLHRAALGNAHPSWMLCLSCSGDTNVLLYSGSSVCLLTSSAIRILQSRT